MGVAEIRRLKQLELDITGYPGWDFDIELWAGRRPFTV